MCVAFLQKAHNLDLPYSVRDGINAIRYTLKQHKTDTTRDTGDLFQNSIRQILGEEALDLESLAQKRKISGEHIPSMNLGDLFFSDDDSLNPDDEDSDQDFEL